MNLTQLRAKIDEVDERLVRLLNERAALAEEVGAVKKNSGQSVFAPEREEMLLNRLDRLNKDGPLSREALRAIYREILSACRQRQKQLRVAYLGPEASNCHQAALQRFGASDFYAPFRTIPEVFMAVSRDEADAAIVPIENSTEGGVNATHDALMETDLVVCGEIFLPIEHVFATAEPEGKVKRVFSHPQALAQCRHWLAEHYSEAELVEAGSTSDGARRAKVDSHGAAIVNPYAARFYGLHIRHRNIQDRQGNATRFLILGKHHVPPSKLDKTTILFAVSHKIGALSSVLSVFSERKINLMKIESRPASGKPWEYVFFVDVQGHREQPVLRDALAASREATLWLKVLGSYPQANTDV
ncbi:MAG: prephenate dehydratase [Candidatus Methylacidiphilales bacterium]